MKDNTTTADKMLIDVINAAETLADKLYEYEVYAGNVDDLRDTVTRIYTDMKGGEEVTLTVCDGPAITLAFYNYIERLAYKYFPETCIPEIIATYQKLERWNTYIGGENND